MPYPKFHAHSPHFSVRLLILAVAAVCALFSNASFAQTLEKELRTSEKPSVKIVNLGGRVTITAATERKDSVHIKATSPGRSVNEKEIIATSAAGVVDITVSPRGLAVRGVDGEEEAAAIAERIDLKRHGAGTRPCGGDDFNRIN
ncbi:MAG: hypothetical protein WKF84_21850 [Pyrinomonadaceae bacterium]